MDVKDNIINALRQVYDPEIPINVYDLGLIYELDVDVEGNAKVLMTLTSPACPTGDYIKSMIEDAVRGVDGVISVEIEITFEPLWSPDRITEEAKEELGFTDTELDNSAVKDVFGSFKEESKLRICFRCGANSDEIPILQVYYKGEETFLCTRCSGKF